MLRVTPSQVRGIARTPCDLRFHFSYSFFIRDNSRALARVAGVKSGPGRLRRPAHPALRPDHERASGQEIAVCSGEFFHYLSTARV